MSLTASSRRKTTPRRRNSESTVPSTSSSTKPEQWRGVWVVVGHRNGKTVARIRYGIFSVASVKLVASELGSSAEILAIRPAEPARPARSPQPRNTDPLAWNARLDTWPDAFDSADDFMAGHDGDLRARQIAIDHVQIRAAHPARQHTHKDLSCTRERDWHLDRLQGAECRSGQHHRTHEAAAPIAML
jgi:hypothetical protein